MVLVLIMAIGFAVLVGWLFESIIAGVIMFFIAFGFFAMKWHEGGAVVNMATQDKRDKAILDELKKMNEDK